VHIDLNNNWFGGSTFVYTGLNLLLFFHCVIILSVPENGHCWNWTWRAL